MKTKFAAALLSLTMVPMLIAGSAASAAGNRNVHFNAVTARTTAHRAAPTRGVVIIIIVHTTGAKHHGATDSRASLASLDR